MIIEKFILITRGHKEIPGTESNPGKLGKVSESPGAQKMQNGLSSVCLGRIQLRGFSAKPSKLGRQLSATHPFSQQGPLLVNGIRSSQFGEHHPNHYHTTKASTFFLDLESHSPPPPAH